MTITLTVYLVQIYFIFLFSLYYFCCCIQLVVFCWLSVVSEWLCWSGHGGSYRGHTTWDPRRHMYEELRVHGPRGRLPPCPGSDETLYHRAGNTTTGCAHWVFYICLLTSYLAFCYITTNKH